MARRLARSAARARREKPVHRLDEQVEAPSIEDRVEWPGEVGREDVVLYEGHFDATLAGRSRRVRVRDRHGRDVRSRHSVAALRQRNRQRARSSALIEGRDPMRARRTLRR